MSDYLDPNNEELLKDFFAEAEQQVEQLECNILVIENDPTNHEAIDEIFRAAHTLKGGSATVEMMELSHFTHSVEDVLDEIRSDKIVIDEDVVDVLLTAIDVIKAMLEARQNGSVYEENIDEIKNKLKAYLDGNKPVSEKKSVVMPSEQQEVAIQVSEETQLSGIPRPPMTLAEFEELKSVLEGDQKLWSVGVKFDESNPMNTVGGIQVFAALKTIGTVLKTYPDFEQLYEDQFFETVFYYIGSNATSDEIEDVAFLSDVTLATDAQPLNESNYAEGNSQTSQTKNTENEQMPTATAEESTKSISAQAPTQEAINQVIQENKQEQNSLELVDKQKQTSSEKKENSKEKSQQGSILRVDSRRVDNLLNLVSEAVINKASFDQLTMQMASELSLFQNLQSQYREKFRNLIEIIPSYVEAIREGKTMNDVKQMIQEDFGSLPTIFEPYEASVKNITSRFRSYTQNLGTIAGELQEGVMKIRMVPINQIFSRFPRVVRDLQRDLNKKINLVIEGEDTELDKSVVEDLLDPIMHCVRNSVDHGIEKPEVRVANGKDETGTVLLKAYNEGNMIVIEIKDDGAGIDVEKVKAKAVSKGLIHPDKVITDSEAYQMIMMPGFSTADKISNISGRGVGLDVVKTMITNLKGSISVSSEKGKETTFTIKLPLTLAIIQGLLVRVGKEIYSIPIANVIETQCINVSEINKIDSYEIMNLRNEVISVLRLSRLFAIKDSVQNEDCYIVIVGTQEKKLGVMVDSLIGEEDVVIKPLKDQFTNSPGIAGASILGDGSVSLIIDVSQLLELGVKQELLAQVQESQEM